MHCVFRCVFATPQFHHRWINLARSTSREVRFVLLFFFFFIFILFYFLSTSGYLHVFLFWSCTAFQDNYIKFEPRLSGRWVNSNSRENYLTTQKQKRGCHEAPSRSPELRPASEEDHAHVTLLSFCDCEIAK